MIVNWFAWAAVGLNGLAAITYLMQGDYPRTTYWTAAVILTGSTIFIR